MLPPCILLEAIPGQIRNKPRHSTDPWTDDVYSQIVKVYAWVQNVMDRIALGMIKITEYITITTKAKQGLSERKHSQNILKFVKFSALTEKYTSFWK